MTRGAPPKVGLWLLRHLGRGYHSESLIGDLIEQCARGQSGWWAWQEIFMAIFITQARRWRSLPGLRVARALWWCLTEVAIMLIIALIADQSQNWRTFKGIFTPNFLVMLMVLFSIAFVGLRSLIRIHHRQRERAATHHLMALFVVMTLGIGTLTWAATVHHDKGQPAAPLEDSTTARPSMVEPFHR
jgi:hypothetical protein